MNTHYKKTFNGILIVVTIFLLIFFINDAFSQRITTETLTAEYTQVQKQVSDGQAQLLRLEGAIRVLEMNAALPAETVTTSTVKRPEMAR